MSRQSAGILLFRRSERGALEVLLVHPGGPLWSKKDAGAWSIPKGEVEPGEDPLAAAQREFSEELGNSARGPFLALGEIRQAGGKLVRAWAAEGDCDVSSIRSNTFSMTWPPKSAKLQSFPEIDRGEWFSLEAARDRILKGQIPLLERLEQALADGAGNRSKGG